LDITKLLEKTSNGTLRKDGLPEPVLSPKLSHVPGYVPPDCMNHRASGPEFLRAQATNELEELKLLARTASGKRSTKRSSPKSYSKTTKVAKSRVTRGVPTNGQSHEEWLVDSFA
jgi:DNA polymerase gamma 1